jgi:Protein of unknown function (DUF2752)
VDRVHRERLTASAVVALAAGGLSVVYLLDPGTSDLYPPCPFLALTGFYCPGCGTLRALHQLSLGHPVAALDLNPLMVLLLPFVAYFLASHTVLALTGRPLKKIFVRPELIWALLGLVLVYWLLRNLPAHPLTLLAP